MNRLLILLGIFVLGLGGCHERTIGYLLTENANYDPDTVHIRKTPDQYEDAMHIKNNSPWVTLDMQGYSGTEQIEFTIESVTSPLGQEAADIFKSELSIRGGGAMIYPLENKASPGTYVISVRLTNPGYSKVVDNVLTFILE